MYVIDSEVGAIACMLLSLFLLGTWPCAMTLLERRGRLPQHTYLDYSITNLLAAVFFALTLGEIGNSTSDDVSNFTLQISQLGANWPSVLFAMFGGLLLSVGNICSQYAWALVGLSATETITASMTVIIGSTLNYFLDDKINNAAILFPGVGCFIIAVCLASAVHESNVTDNWEKVRSLSGEYDQEESVDASTVKESLLNKDIEALENANITSDAKFGTAGFLVKLEERRAIKVSGKSTLIGLTITFLAGFCFSLFSPAFNLATNDQFHNLKKGVQHLSVYTAFFWFSASGFILAVTVNAIFLYCPALELPRSSLKAYVNDWNGRGWALLAGFLSGVANALQLIAGEAAGYAAADAVQAYPLVSTLWGIFLFGEYYRSSRRTYTLLVGMLFMFLVAVIVLMASSGQRKEYVTV